MLKGWLVAALGKRIELEMADAAGTLEPSVGPATAIWPELAAFAHPAERVHNPVMHHAQPVRIVLGHLSRDERARRRGLPLLRSLSVAGAHRAASFRP